MKAAILTALAVEYQAVLSHLSEIKTVRHPKGTIYQYGTVTANSKTIHIYLAEIGSGNTASSAEVERAVGFLNPDVVLFVGVAGGLKDVQLGDVVAATKIYNFASGKAKENFLTRPETNWSSYRLEQQARFEARECTWRQLIKSKSASIPNARVGPLAAGEVVVASKRSAIFRFLKESYGDAVAIEMEGHGVLHSARLNQPINAMVIRGISDLIEKKSASDSAGWQETASQNAAAFAIQLLLSTNLENGEAEAEIKEHVSVEHQNKRPFLAHPVPTPMNWVGRSKEINDLDLWLRSGGMAVCIMTAIGGTGKSSLAWHWLNRDGPLENKTTTSDGVFQWSFYDGEMSFHSFLEALARYLGIPESNDLLTSIIVRLRGSDILMVLDGFERLLNLYACADAGLVPESDSETLQPINRRCSDLTTVRFIEGLVDLPRAKILLVSRLEPLELEMSRCKRLSLSGLGKEDAIQYLRAFGIKGTDSELESAASVYDFHPLSLSTLATVLHYNAESPDDIRMAPRYDVTENLRGRRQHILKRAFDALPVEYRDFLSIIAAVRVNPNINIIRTLPMLKTFDLEAGMRRLEDDRWIFWQRESGEIQVHPVIRRYAYGRLKDRVKVHREFANIFGNQSAVDPDMIDDVTKLSTVIEYFFHTARSGSYDSAAEIMRMFLSEVLYFRFGAYQTRLELLAELFSNSDFHECLVNSSEYRAWTLNVVGNSFKMAGQPRKATEFIEKGTLIRKELSRSNSNEILNLLIGNHNLAAVHQTLGEFRLADEENRTALRIACDLKSGFREGMAREQLGELFSYRGRQTEAKTEWEKALRLFHSTSRIQALGTVWRSRAFSEIRCGNAKAAMDAAYWVTYFMEKDAELDSPVEHDKIFAHLVNGAAKTLMGVSIPNSPKINLFKRESEVDLAAAMEGCRRCRLALVEPAIEISIAKWHHAFGELQVAAQHCRNALKTAERCESRLDLAEASMLLARILRRLNLEEEAKECAQEALRFSWCDGPDFCYHLVVRESHIFLGLNPPTDS